MDSEMVRLSEKSWIMTLDSLVTRGCVVCPDYRGVFEILSENYKLENEI